MNEKIISLAKSRMRQTYIWGAGDYGRKTFCDCSLKGIQIECFIDSNKLLQGEILFGLPIISIEDFLENSKKEGVGLPKVIIAMTDESAICDIIKILENAGFKEKCDFDVCYFTKLDRDIMQKSIYKPKLQKMENYAKKIIFTSDSKLMVGGFADRLRGLLFSYWYAKLSGINFKINWTEPENLINYLIPNKYNWTINEDDIIYNAEKSYELLLPCAEIPFYVVFSRISNIIEKHEQLHIATNYSPPFNANFKTLFNELFKFTDYFQNKINSHLNIIEDDFISAHFRFVNLIDVFEHVSDRFPTLCEDKRTELINRCLCHLQEIHNDNPGKKIFVSSDSVTFIEIVKKLDFVYTASGKIGHIYLKHENKTEVFEKVLIDFFLLAYSKKIYSIVDRKMYGGCFARTAALINNSIYILKKY